MIFTPNEWDNTIRCTLSNSDGIVTHWNKINLGDLTTLAKFYNVLTDAMDEKKITKNTEASFTSMKLTTNGVNIKVDFNNEYYDCLKFFQSGDNITSNKGYIKIKLIKF